LRNAIEARLKESLDATYVEVVDESHLHAGHAGARSGGGHYRVVVVSAKFEGLSRVKAQQLVYGAMGAWMGKEIHALSMQISTPASWRQARAEHGDKG
jgi:BolA protein